MNLDLGEDEPRGTEHIARRSGKRGWHSRGAAWAWRTWRPWRAWAAIAAILAVLAIVTGLPILTIAAILAVLTSLALWAGNRRHARDGGGDGGTGLPRVSGVALRTGRTGITLRAVRTRPAHAVLPSRPPRTRRSSGARRSSGTRSTDDVAGTPRRRLVGKQDAEDDSRGEGQNS
jgi:hypothetical protein